jgi:hypothetical protein
MAVMRRTGLVFALLFVSGLASVPAARRPQPSADPFAFFKPEVTLSAGDRQAVDRGEARVRILSHRDRDVAVFGVTAIRIDGDRLIAWVREIARMKQSPAVLAVGRFSEPPRVEDLERLELDENDLTEIPACRPGDCDLKLGAGEMAALQKETAGRPASAWRPLVQQAFRRIVVDRVRAYQASGMDGLPPYADKRPPRLSKDAFATLLDQSKSLKAGLPELAAVLTGPPRAVPGVESFFYWSKERFSGKPVISATHVRIVRSTEPNVPAVVVIGQQLFATHYINSSLSVTSLVRGSSGGHNYLVYLNRSEVDVIGGIFGGVARMVIQRRIGNEADELLAALRKRLERGDPPK